MSEVINGYALIRNFSNQNAGTCQWAFAKKNGHEYFIKQLLYPKYPTLETEKNVGVEIAAYMKRQAEAFYQKKTVYYDAIRECRCGNLVVIEEFFREKEFYYLVTDRMKGDFLSIEQISKLDDEKKRALIKSLLYSIVKLHEKGIVHSDLKPENIMVKQTQKGYCAAKIIDFESGFFVNEPPEEIEGDQRYFSPEAMLRNDGRNVPLNTKSDVFALGLLFHQYWCGELPGYNKSEYCSASVALLNHEKLKLSNALPGDMRQLIAQMVEKRQENRITSIEALVLMTGHKLDDVPRRKELSKGRDGKGAAELKGFYHADDMDL